MRDIEFRGRSSDNGEWFFGCLVKMKNGQAEICTNAVDDIISRVNVIPKTVGQYTGLKDKNGVRIFEGDIVNIKYDYCENGVAKVIFDNGQFIGISIDGCDETINHAKFPVEVIGNIHDNPELLERAK